MFGGQGDAGIVQQADGFLEDLGEIEADAAHEFFRNQDEHHLHIADMGLVVIGQPDDVPRDVNQQGILAYLIGIEVEVHFEVALLQKEKDVAVEADGVFEHVQDGLARFDPLAADFPENDVIPDGGFIDEWTQGKDALDIDGLHFFHIVDFLQR